MEEFLKTLAGKTRASGEIRLLPVTRKTWVRREKSDSFNPVERVNVTLPSCVDDLGPDVLRKIP